MDPSPVVKSPAAITQLLHLSQGGNKAAFDELIPVVYDDLYRLASRRMASERREHTLRTTDLVHESYLRLVGADVDWNDRAHFYAIAAQVMRRILIDYAKNRNRDKRGGQMERVQLDTAFDLSAPGHSDLLEVNEALERLTQRDPRKGSIVELIVFGGMTYDEAAEALGISAATLHRELKLAKAFLQRELTAVRPVPSAGGHSSAGLGAGPGTEKQN
jgi:RNA polymerase sigma factor (TIGR02999 family)